VAARELFCMGRRVRSEAAQLAAPPTSTIEPAKPQFLIHRAFPRKCPTPVAARRENKKAFPNWTRPPRAAGKSFHADTFRGIIIPQPAAAPVCNALLAAGCRLD
jgi:hypothetical protein